MIPEAEEDRHLEMTAGVSGEEKETSTDDKEEEEKEEDPDFGGTSKVMKMYGSGYTCWWILGSLFSVLSGCTWPTFAYLFAEMLDSLIYAADMLKEARQVVIMYVCIGVFSFLTNTAGYYCIGRYAANIGARVRRVYLSTLLRQEVGYHDSNSSGKLNTELNTNSFAIENGCGPKLFMYYSAYVGFFVGLSLSFYYSWRMTLIQFAAMPVIAVGSIAANLVVFQGGDAADPFSSAGSFSNEILINIRTVMAFPMLLISKSDQYKAELLKGYPISRTRTLVTGMSIGFNNFAMFSVAYSIGLWYGSILIRKDIIDISQMFGCFFAFQMAGMSLGQMGGVASDIKNAKIAANKFLQLMNREPISKPPDNQPIKEMAVKGDIEFREVNFAYPSAPTKYVLENVSFRLKSGANMAIVGPSGSGKSTVVSLIERFYDAMSGDIFIDGEAIHNYDISFLRSQMGLVSQLPLLFDMSIKENIKHSNPNISDDDVVDAAKMADAHEFILGLANGYDTKVGEMGGRLSGGQRQRISIARAIATKPAILLLDEATSALDTKSEKEVQRALDHIAKSNKDLTMITIAHRLSTVKHCDPILVLVDGEIDEMGSHSQLMNNDGVYAALVQSQALIDEKRHDV